VHYLGHLSLPNLNGTSRDTTAGAFELYCQSKLANVLFTRRLQRFFREKKQKTLSAFAVHPGIVDTDFILHFIPLWLAQLARLILIPLQISPQEAATNVIYSALSDDLNGVGGEYISNCHVAMSSQESLDDDIAQQLWDLSEKLTNTAQ